MVNRETQPFKLDIRKLKKLGLTRSLDVGKVAAVRAATSRRWTT